MVTNQSSEKRDKVGFFWQRETHWFALLRKGTSQPVMNHRKNNPQKKANNRCHQISVSQCCPQFTKQNSRIVHVLSLFYSLCSSRKVTQVPFQVTTVHAIRSCDLWLSTAGQPAARIRPRNLSIPTFLFCQVLDSGAFFCQFWGRCRKGWGGSDHFWGDLNFQ